MKLIQSPSDEAVKGLSVFIAGGITGCDNWQSELIAQLESAKLTLVNPRRNGDFATADAVPQIQWEQRRLSEVTAIAFWFPNETLCPITLFELGTLCVGVRKIFVGCHPEYKRRLDVVEQLRYYSPDTKVVSTIKELAKQIQEFGELYGR